MIEKAERFIPKGAQGFRLKLEKGETKVLYTILHHSNSKTNFEILRSQQAYLFQIRKYFKGYENKWRPSNYPLRLTTGQWVELIIAFNACAKFFKENEK